METNKLAGLQPANVFAYFEEICGIPHGSGNTKPISDYLVAFAKEHRVAGVEGLEYVLVGQHDQAGTYADQHVGTQARGPVLDLPLQAQKAAKYSGAGDAQDHGQ